MGVPVDVFSAMPESVLSMLRRRNVSLEELARQVLVRHGEALLLTGSYATGEANPTSDLDLLVLTRTDDSRAPEEGVNHPSMFGDSFDVFLADLNVNIEYVPQAKIEDLGAVLTRVSNGKRRDIANLQGLELRLAQRTATGIPLMGADVVSTMRRALDAEVARKSAAALAHARLKTRSTIPCTTSCAWTGQATTLPPTPVQARSAGRAPG